MKIGFHTSQGLVSRLAQSSRQISRALERLSSGRAVLKPKDDILRFSQSTRLESQVRALRQSQINIVREQNLLQSSQNILGSLSDIVQQMRDLALQGSSSVLSSGARAQINESLKHLMQEYARVSHGAEFDGHKLISSQLLPANAFLKEAPKGDFELFASQSIGFDTSKVLLRDVNNDGQLDRVISDKNANLIRIAFGNGDGSFQEEITFSVGAGDFRAFEMADLSGDGNQDLVISKVGVIEIYLGDGQGSFTFSNSVASTQTDIERFEIFDFDGDGDLDIVGFGKSVFAGRVGIRLQNDGTGVFSSLGIISGATDIIDAVAADFDGDGIIDIAYIREGEKGGSSILGIQYGNGNGTFSAEQTHSVTPAFDPMGNRTAQSLTFGDLSGDGFLDILVSNKGGQLVRFVNNGAGSFLLPNAIGNLTLNDMKLVDINGNGHLDLVGVTTSAAQLVLLLSNGAGAFGNARSFALSAEAKSLALGDLNGDGSLDVLLASDSGAIETFLGKNKLVTGLDAIHVHTPEDAQRLLEILDRTTELLQKERGAKAAKISALEFRESFTELLEIQVDEAFRRTTEADLVIEMTNLISAQILQQAQLAALTQANLNKQVILQLLRFDN